MKTPRRVGYVQWGGASLLAELFSDGTWRASLAGKDQPAMAAAIAELYQDFPSGPENGNPARRFLEAYAKRVGGTWVLLEGQTNPGLIH